jgi:hypothetical protein
VNDGPFKAWDKKGTITEEAMVSDHKVHDQKWHGAFAHFISVIDICMPSKNAFHTFVMKLKDVFNENEIGDSLPYKDRKALDSLLASALISNKQCIDNINKLEEFPEMPSLKSTGSRLLQMHREFLSKTITEALALLKTGFTDENVTKTRESLAAFIQKDLSEKNFTDALAAFQKQYVFDAGQIGFFRQKFPDALIN